jgi:hypothetical protein
MRRSPSSGSSRTTSSVTRWNPRGPGAQATSRWSHIAAQSCHAHVDAVPANGTPSVSSSARWRSPFAERAVGAARHGARGRSGSSAAWSTGAGEPRRARRHVAVAAHVAGGIARTRARDRLCAARTDGIVSHDTLPPGATRHILDRRPRPRDGRGGRRRAVALVQRRLGRLVGARLASGRSRRSRSAIRPTARTRSTSSPTAWPPDEALRAPGRRRRCASSSARWRSSTRPAASPCTRASRCIAYAGHRRAMATASSRT